MGARPAVDVWRVALDVPDAAAEALGALLDADERRRAARFVHARDGRRFAVAHGALRAILAAAAGERDPGRLRFATGWRGKPRLDGGGPHFSLAHSDGVALVAVCADRPVGVDVERVHDAGRGGAAVARRQFTPAEKAWLAGAADPERAFCRLWAWKESCAKEDGLGVSDLRRIAVAPPGDDGGDGGAVLSARDGARAWSIVELDPGPGYVGALAVAGDPPVVRSLDWEPPAGAG